MLNSDFLRLIPDGATHCLVEERTHRGDSVFAVVAVIPDGCAVPLNSYSDAGLAERVCCEANLTLTSSS